MAADELRHLLPEGVASPEPDQHGVRQRRAPGGMAVKVPHAVFVQGEAVGLSHIVEQGRKAQALLRRDGVQGVEGMLPEVIAVVGIPLAKTHHGGKLRPEDPEDLRKRPQHRRRPGPEQQLSNLCQDPFRRDDGEIPPRRREGGGGLRLDGEIQHRREAKPPEDAQGVLPKAPRRLSHAADTPLFQILPPAEGVPQLPPQGEGHGVNGEIPPGQILLQGSRKGDALRAAVVGVVPVPAERGDLRGAPGAADGDGSVAEPCGQGVWAEEGQGLLWPGGGGDVPVLRHPAKQGVPHAAAHAVSLVSRRLQRPQDASGKSRDIHVISPLTSRRSSRHRTISSVPRPIRAQPARDFAVKRSCRKRKASASVMTTLSLSTGTTLDASPICSAR